MSFKTAESIRSLKPFSPSQDYPMTFPFLPKAFQPFQHMYHYNIIAESSPIWQKLNPIIVMMNDYEEALENVSNNFHTDNDTLDGIRMMEHEILQEVKAFLAEIE